MGQGHPSFPEVQVALKQPACQVGLQAKYYTYKAPGTENPFASQVHIAYLVSTHMAHKQKMFVWIQSGRHAKALCACAVLSGSARVLDRSIVSVVVSSRICVVRSQTKMYSGMFYRGGTSLTNRLAGESTSTGGEGVVTYGPYAAGYPDPDIGIHQKLDARDDMFHLSSGNTDEGIVKGLVYAKCSSICVLYKSLC